MKTNKDCINIPSLVKSDGAVLQYNGICGQGGLVTTEGEVKATTALKTLCCKYQCRVENIRVNVMYIILTLRKYGPLHSGRRGGKKSKLHFQFWYGKTHGKGIFNKFDQNHKFSAL